MKKIIIILFSISIMFSDLWGQEIIYNQEFQINLNGLVANYSPMVATLSNGGFIVCWGTKVDEKDNWKERIFYQIYDPNGQKRGNESQIHSSIDAHQRGFSVTGLPDGGFAICWVNYQFFNPGNETRIMMQFFDKNYQKIGQELQIEKQFNHLNAEQLHIMVHPEKKLIIYWTAYSEETQEDIYGQFIDMSGEKVGNKFRINSTTTGKQFDPDLTILKNGDLLFCWNDIQEDQNTANILGQFIDINGIKKGDEFQISNNSKYWPVNPSVTTLNNGNFVVCWETENQENQIFHDWKGVYGQIFDASGMKIGKEFHVNSLEKDYQTNPLVKSLPNEGFLVIWLNTKSSPASGPIKSFMNFFNQSGEKKGVDFQLANPIVTFGISPNNTIFLCWITTNTPYGNTVIMGKFLPAITPSHSLNDFQLISPKNDSTINTTRPQFIWQQPISSKEIYPWEISFDLYIDHDFLFSNPMIIENIMDTTFTPDTLAAGETYIWKVKAKNFYGDCLWSSNYSGFFIKPGATFVEENKMRVATEFSLNQNYPNPFSQSTTFSFSIPAPNTSFSCLSIYNIKGQLIKTFKTETANGGYSSIDWNGEDSNGQKIATGIYFYVLKMGTLQLSKKFLYIKN